MTVFMFLASILQPHTNASQAASGIKDVPSQIKISMTSNFNTVSQQQELFGTSEKRSTKMKAFTKWSEMFDRFHAQIATEPTNNKINHLKTKLSALQDLPLAEMTKRVNAMINKTTYINDSKNWGKSDYWATPIEFLSRGGDCEDFAIAKYTALRMLGVSEDLMRIAIVHDKVKNIPHAVLIVYTEDGVLILDNQRKTVWTNAEAAQRYRAIYTINRTAWWLHGEPKLTQLASAE